MIINNMEHTWSIHGAYMEHTWSIHGASLEEKWWSMG